MTLRRRSRFIPKYITKTLIFVLTLLFISANTLLAQQRVLAVGPFQNLGPIDENWLETGIKQILYDKLNFIESVLVTNPSILERNLIKFTNGNVYNLDPKVAYKINKKLGTEIAIVGKYKFIGNDLEVGYQILNLYTGTPIFSNTLRQNKDTVLDLINQMALDFVTQTEINVTPRDRQKIEEKITTTAKAFEFYCKAYVEFNSPSPRSQVVRSLFRKAIDLDADFWEAQYNLGTVLYNDRLYKQAIDQFTGVINRQPTFYKAYFGRGLIYLKFKQYENALQEFEIVKQQDPENKRVDYYMGMLYNRTGKTLDAVSYLQKAVRKDPEFERAFYELGNAYVSRNNPNKAITNYKEAIKLEPNFPEAHHQLGLAYASIKQYDNAIFEYKAAISKDASYANAYFDLANAYYKRGVLQEYIDNYLDIVRTQENQNTKITRSASISPNMQNAYDEIIDALLKAIDADPGFYEAHFNIALTYHKYGKYAEAELHYDKTIELNPNLIKAHMQYGYALEEQNRIDEALARFKAVVRIRPDYFDPKSNLGEKFFYKNPIDEVMKEAEANLAKNPDDLDSHLVLAKIYDAIGNRRKALAEYREVQRLDPSNQLANERIEQIEQKLN
jgi:tetratricopeptide (TPR) repeat protein